MPEKFPQPESLEDLQNQISQKQKELFEVLGVENREEAKELDLDKLDDETIKKATEIKRDIEGLREEKQNSGTKKEILAGQGIEKEGPFIITIDYDKPLEELLKEGGYDGINLDITEENFPKPKTGTETKEMFLFRFDKTMLGDEVEGKLNELGYEPAGLYELLTLGAQDKELKDIVALGSVFVGPRGDRDVLVLWGNERRYTNLHWYDNDWLSDYRFAAVRK